MVYRITFIIFLFYFSAVTASLFPFDEVQVIYQDEELKELWSSIEDIKKPVVDDYVKIENYLRYGKRPYLDAIFSLPYLSKYVDAETLDRSEAFSNRILQKIMLVGLNREPPIFKTIYLGGASPFDLSRCIVFYSSYNHSPHTFDINPLYSQKMLEVINELQSEGYKGHVLFRIGGYPLEERGGLRLVHVPYSFKILSIIEAAILGYKNILWLDTTIHPTNNLNKVFSIIARKGVFLLGGGTKFNCEYDSGILSDLAIMHCSLKKRNLRDIDHILAGVIGFSMENEKVKKLMQEWYRLTSIVYPAMTLYPEQFLLSVAAWRVHLEPTDHFSSYLDLRSSIPIRPTQNPKKPFWFDKG
jgi:hypothetical protein